LLSLQIIAFSLHIDHQTTPFCCEIHISFERIAAVALQRQTVEIRAALLLVASRAAKCAPQSCQYEPHAIDATRQKE